MSNPLPSMVMGIETEYGLLVRGPYEAICKTYDAAATKAANLLVQVMRDDAVAMGDQLPITVHRHEPGASWQHISNGARYYLDGRHPEMSIPECWTPREAVVWDAAGERLMAQAMQTVNEQLEYRVDVHKRNTDSSGHSWGCHENYCISPALFVRLCKEERRVAEQKTLATFMAVRQILTGSGKVGFARGGARCAFQLSQRADFIDRFRGANTTSERPLIQTRDTSYSGGRWSRLHVICGDANCMQWPTHLKLSLTSLLLMLWMDRERQLPPLPVLDDDYPAITRMISRDPEFDCVFPVRMYQGGQTFGTKRKMKAYDILSHYVDALQVYANARAWDLPAEAASYRDAVRVAQEAMVHVRAHAWRRLYGLLEWPTKRVVVEEYLHKKGFTWEQVLTDPNVAFRVRTLANISFTAVNPTDSILAKLTSAGRIKTLAKGSEIVRAMTEAPCGRARQRSAVAAAYAAWAHGIGWERVDLLQDSHEIVVRFPDPRGCTPDDAFHHAIGLCPMPLDLHALLRKRPLDGVVVTAQMRTTNA